MPKRWMLLIGFLLMVFVLSACSSPFTSGVNRGMDQEITITAEDVPEELPADEIISSIQASPSDQIDAIIASHFSLMDTVAGEESTAQIYATAQFELEELASVITSAAEPKETSEVVDNQQIFIYPGYFVTLKPSEDDKNVLLIEVAEEAFVERNYSPSFLSTYFTIRMLDSLFGNNWSSSMSRTCQTADCYGGYTGKTSGSGMGTPNRGSTTFRGGGPGTGK